MMAPTLGDVEKWIDELKQEHKMDHKESIRAMLAGNVIAYNGHIWWRFDNAKCEFEFKGHANGEFKSRDINEYDLTEFEVYEEPVKIEVGTLLGKVIVNKADGGNKLIITGVCFDGRIGVRNCTFESIDELKKTFYIQGIDF